MSTTTSTTDQLTSLPTKEAFEKEFIAAFSLTQESQNPLTLASADIDHFLIINQEHGHDVGDEVLKELAGILQRLTSEETLVFRYAGDEFFLLFPNTTREQAFLVMEKIRSQIEQTNAYGKVQVNVTISTGIASYPIDAAERDELLRKTDQAMYRAKNAGANQILLAYDEKMIPKTNHYTETQLERLSILAKKLEVTEARLLREGLDDLINKYKDPEFE
jgi:diguanylate cyclase (GGDEF)-like protein